MLKYDKEIAEYEKRIEEISNDIDLINSLPFTQTEKDRKINKTNKRIEYRELLILELKILQKGVIVRTIA